MNGQQETTRQTLYIIRHGVAQHNIPIPVKSTSTSNSNSNSNSNHHHHRGSNVTYQHANVRDPMYTDSKLVLPRAYEQATRAGKKLKRSLMVESGNTSLDCVFVSPLSRCFETAYFVMKELEVVDGQNDVDGGGGQNLKGDHCNQAATLSTATARPNGSSQSVRRCTPWMCREELREAYGIHYSDKRSTRSILEVHTKCIFDFCV